MDNNPMRSRPLSDLKPPDELTTLYLEADRRPFISVGTSLIPVHRVISIDFTPTGRVRFSNKGEIILFEEDLPFRQFHDNEEYGETTTPVLSISYLDHRGKVDYARRHGEEARILWKYMSTFLAL